LHESSVLSVLENKDQVNKYIYISLSHSGLPSIQDIGGGILEVYNLLQQSASPVKPPKRHFCFKTAKSVMAKIQKKSFKKFTNFSSLSCSVQNLKKKQKVV
jgi:hypothetical protein